MKPKKSRSWRSKERKTQWSQVAKEGKEAIKAKETIEEATNRVREAKREWPTKPGNPRKPLKNKEAKDDVANKAREVNKAD